MYWKKCVNFVSENLIFRSLDGCHCCDSEASITSAQYSENALKGPELRKITHCGTWDTKRKINMVVNEGMAKLKLRLKNKY